VNGILVRVGDLGAERRARMHTLLQRHFDGVTRDGFELDLQEKNWVILLEEDGALVGFSTLLLYPFTHRGETLTVIYSGDTIVDPAAWGTSTLPRSWIGAVRKLHAAHGTGRLLWLLITSGFRTYRFLPVFWREFHPRHDAAMPPATAALRDAIARHRFGAAYDPATGVVRLPRPQRLRDHLASIPEERQTDPHVAFFDQANPGHGYGDELVCLTELSEANLTRAGWRMVRAGATGDADSTRGASAAAPGKAP
jgi:hypothetical protein